MAAFHGKMGKVMWDSATGSEVELDHCTAWDCSVSADVAETTELAAGVSANTWKTYVAGGNNWTATVTCSVDDSDIDIPLTTGGVEAMGEDTPAKLELWLDATSGVLKILYGSAICNGFEMNTPVDGVKTVTYNFQGVATLAYGTADPSYA